MLLSLDVEKAFDRVEHSYILALLKYMNFGSRFLTALRALYMPPKASVKVNGHISSSFSVARGTLQGCPLSPLQFTLAIEPLAEALQNEARVQGVLKGQKTHTLSLFADDMVLYVTEPETSLRAIEDLLEEFRNVLGLNVNTDKSLIYPLTVTLQREEIIKTKYNFGWVKDHWKYLGVRIPLDFTWFSKLNLESVHKSVQESLKLWNNKMLSWSDRIQLVKTMIFPKFLYLFRTAPLGVTSKLLQEWQRSLLDFVWQYKKPRLSKDLMCSLKQSGGLGLPDLEAYYWATLLTTFLKRYSDLFTAPWKDVMNGALTPYDFHGLAWNKNLGRKFLPSLSSINKASLTAW